MSKIRLFYIFLILTLFILFTSISSVRYQVRKLEEIETQRNIDFALKLKNCFDFENKIERGLNESIILIEYCMEFYGMD